MIWILLIAVQGKHIIADYFLQSRWMLRKQNEMGWILPLSAHCLVHAAGTLAICLAIDWRLSGLAAVDFLGHFAIDRIKGSATRGIGPMNSAFWQWHGLDQYAHFLKNLFIVYVLMEGSL